MNVKEDTIILKSQNYVKFKQFHALKDITIIRHYLNAFNALQHLLIALNVHQMEIIVHSVLLELVEKSHLLKDSKKYFILYVFLRCLVTCESGKYPNPDITAISNLCLACMTHCV